MSDIASSTTSFAQAIWESVRVNCTYLVSQPVNSWFSLVWKWVRDTGAGKLSAGLLAFLVARPVTDYVMRKIRRYPLGTMSLLPGLVFNPDDNRFLLSQAKRYGDYSLYWLGFNPAILVNTRKAAEFIFLQPNYIVTRSNKMTKDERMEHEKIFRPAIGPLSFVMVDEEMNWKDRRGYFERSKKFLLNDMRTARIMIGQYFKDKFECQIKSGDIWYQQRQALHRMQFYTLFHFGFGAEIEPKLKEMDDFIQSTQDAFDTQHILFMCQEFPVKWMGLKLIQLFNGSKSDAVKKFKDITAKWMDRYEDSPGRRDAHYAHILQKHIDRDQIQKDHAVADIAINFFAGTHTTSTVIEQSLMHCARNLEFQQMMHQQLRNEFDHPDNLNIKDIKNKVPSLIAFVWETLRLSETVRLSLTRVLHEPLDTEDGYRLPLGAVTFLNIYALNRDTQEWGKDALEFKPKRYFKGDLLDLEKRQRILAFGLGKRMCPGYDLAESKIILILSHFIWRYKIEAPFGDANKTLPLLIDSDFNHIQSQLPLRYTLLD